MSQVTSSQFTICASASASGRPASVPAPAPASCPDCSIKMKKQSSIQRFFKRKHEGTSSVPVTEEPEETTLNVNAPTSSVPVTKNPNQRAGNEISDIVRPLDLSSVCSATDLDYRSMKDDAWYTSGIVLEDGKQLRVKFRDFVQSYNDEVFSIADFSTHHELDRFLCRFRPVSEPIEENQCSRVIEGMVVCATYKGDGLFRFDAVVDAVHYKEHTPEKCLCTYILFWQHGPEEGNITATNIDDICLIMPGAVDPRVTDFAKLVKEKLRGASSQSTLISKSPFLSSKTGSNKTLNELQELGSARHSSYVACSEGRERFFPQLSDHDRDLGSVKETGGHHYIILENLEKDLSPSLMMEFIHEQTSMTAQAYLFPSLSAETYARGAIVSDNRSQIKRIYEFLSNPNQIVVSLSGRPWVIAEDMLRTGTFDTNLQCLLPFSENNNAGSKLMVVRLGTEEYMRAKKLKDLYMEFREHQNLLLQRLDLEEKNCHPSGAN